MGKTAADVSLQDLTPNSRSRGDTIKMRRSNESASARSAKDLLLCWGFAAWLVSGGGSAALVLSRFGHPLVVVSFAVFIPLSLIAWCLSRGYLYEERYLRGSLARHLAFVPEVLAFLGAYVTSLIFPHMSPMNGILCLGLWAIVAFMLRVLVFRDLSVSLLIWNTWLSGTGALALLTERFGFLTDALESALSLQNGARETALEIVKTALNIMSSIGVPILVGGTAFLAATGFGLFSWSTRGGRDQDAFKMEVALRTKAVAYAMGFLAFAGILLNEFFLPLMRVVIDGMRAIALGV